MNEHVIVCGRCGRENSGSWAGPGKGHVLEEPGWVYYRPAYLEPLVAPPRGRLGYVLTSPSDEPQHVCPACQTDEERPSAEHWAVVTCGRCGRQSRGTLDEHGGDTEWEEPGWAYQMAAVIEPMDEPDGVEFLLGSCGHVCPGCQTGEEYVGLLSEGSE